MNKIPKIAHFYWGNQKMSFLRFLTLFSFIKYNPEWEVVLHTSSLNDKEPEFRKTDFHRYDVLDYKNEKDYREFLPSEIKIQEHDLNEYFAYSDKLSEANKSDFIGWKILSSVGGVWSDMDILFVKSLKDSQIQFENNDTFVCFDPRISNPNHPRPSTPIGFLMASENNALYQEIFKNSQNAFLEDSYQSLGSEIMSNTLISLENCKNKFPNLKIQNLDPDLFYKYNYLQIENIFILDKFSELMESPAIGIHWYGGHETSSLYNNFYDHANYNSKWQSTLTKAIDLLDLKLT